MRNKKTNFALLLHSHQPIGNMPEIFEGVFRKAYLPLIEVLKKNPEIKVTLHYSGILLEWLRENHPEFLETIKELLHKGQVELTTGGFYEPILSVIPEEDKVGQIRMLTNFIEDNFEYYPQGMWLAERIWEPHLPKPLSQAGVEYVVLDDSHFDAAGLEEKDLFGYFVTEERGYQLNVFPSNMELRYLIPFAPPDKVIKYLRNLNKQGAELVVMGDDGEKFGSWPETYQQVYEKQWLEKFLGLIVQNGSWLNTVTLSEYLDKDKPLGRVYLPTASYSEMTEWSLPASKSLKYEELVQKLKKQGNFNAYKFLIKGGHWRNYFVKYPESNNLHKKMLYVSSKVHKSNKPEALEELWKGQCNDGYWHGIFGGLYLPHLRSALYSHLIKAEVLADEEIRGKEPWQEVEIGDFDKDGCDEILISASNWNLYFDYQEGGTLFELDYRPKAVNLLNTLARRKEAYHRKLAEASGKKSGRKVKSIHEMTKVKEEGLEKYLIYDRYRRVSFVDHFFPLNLKLSAFRETRYEELGDFVSGDYLAEVINKNPIELHLERCGDVLGEKVLVEKNFILDKKESKMTIDYQITNLGRQTLNLYFGIEFNLFFLGETEGLLDELTWDNKLKEISDAQAGEVKIRDLENNLSVGLNFSEKARFFIFPVETVSQSEEGFERIYQGTALLPFWRLDLGAQERWQLRMKKVIREETK